MGQKETLYIPTKILDSDDYIQGFGNVELTITGIAAVAAVVAGIICYQITQNTFPAVMLAMALIFVTIFLIRRDICNENMFQKLHILQKNKKIQKQYWYQYHNIYEDIQYEE